MKSKILISGLFALGVSLSAGGAKVVGVPMDITGNMLQGTGVSLNIEGRFSPMQITGADGNAWRTDGNSSRATGHLPLVVDGNSMTASMRFAIDTYTIVEHEAPGANDRYVEVISCLDEGAATGFGFFMNRTGKYLAKVGVGGEIVELRVDERIPLWEWTEASIVVEGRKVRLFINGILKVEKDAPTAGVKVGNSILYVGRANAHGEIGGTETCAFNGAFDDISIYDESLTPTYNATYADLNLPSDRYAGDRMRARYHGQPGMNWTNETHGLYYNEGDRKWHAFFQRTGSTPMMSHQHWGHIVSEDMITWHDDVPVLAPSEFYDIKGCWSGCVFSDQAFNNGNPTIIYTGVDYAKPYVATAYCDDPVNMRRWHKDPLNPINIMENVGDGRDTYFYRDGVNAYFMVGARDAVHYYQWNGSKWNYRGEFYHTEDGVDNGHNTEMPNVTRIGDKWLMTTSPLAGKYGTVCLYRTGSLSDGRFVNYSAADKVDFFGCDGYGLLSPSPYTTADGKVYAIGIVPDKLPGDLNVKHGYAHLYSLPREWSLDSEGRLLQKPYAGINAYRHENMTKKVGETRLDGTLNLNPVRGREAEVCARFLLTDATVGLNFFKNTKGRTAYISYNPVTREIVIDYGRIAHYDNGRTSFRSVLDLGPGKGEELKLHVFIDHSIVDIFVNDRYASSVRVFPDDDNADLIELFSNGLSTLLSAEAYVLGEGDMSDEPIVPKEFTLPENSGKVAFLCSSNALSAQEQAALDFFTGKLKNNNVILTSEPQKINSSDFDCVWIHIDRIGLPKGVSNLPGEFIGSELIETLRKFVGEGGNLYLSGQATQLLVSLQRISSGFAPNEYNAGDGNDGDDEWTVNPWLAGGKYDRTGHTLYAGLEKSDNYAWTTYGLLYGGGERIRREDHNCMWKLSDFDYVSEAADHIRCFEEDNAARVLGTWGQEQTDGWAGIIEFYPTPVDEETDSWSGTILANGLAACQWHVEGAGNSDAENLMLLTANAFVYLADKDGQKPENPHITVVTPPDDPEIPHDPAEILESTGKVALYLGYESEADFLDVSHQYYAQDRLIYDFFRSEFPQGEMLYTGDLNRLTPENFDCVWVHCDRKGLAQGWRNLPGTFTGIVDDLKAYSDAGGNIYFSKMASQLVVAMGRTSHEPMEFSSGDGGFNSDDWFMNIAHHEGVDWSDHSMFQGMGTVEESHGVLVLLNAGSHVREDHNCMWRLNDCGGHDNFCRVNNARVIGTWGHNGGQEFAGLVEFMPGLQANAAERATSKDRIVARRGTIVANGLAAHEFNADNAALDNVKKLSANILSYLSPVEAVVTGVENRLQNDDTDMKVEWFTLQGLHVDTPAAPGVYIWRNGTRTGKIVVR